MDPECEDFLATHSPEEIADKFREVWTAYRCCRVAASAVSLPIVAAAAVSS